MSMKRNNLNKKKARVICITPVRNEDWIIERFIRAAYLWADDIIIADQMSTDKTRSIIAGFSKVKIINNASKTFNENERQKILINAAREIPGKKLLVALDADEFLTGNFIDSEEWDRMLYSESGTLFIMNWPCIAPDFKRYWMTDGSSNVFAYMDDGTPHIGTSMHSVRLPVSPNSIIIHLSQIEVMHFQYTDWSRMKSKNLWYQCYERINNPHKSIFEIYRMYHHMDVKHKYNSIPDTWFNEYNNNGINLCNNGSSDNHYWWEDDVIEFKKRYGDDYFKYIDFKNNNNVILLYLRRTQFLWKYKYGKAFLRRLDVVVNTYLLKNK